MYMAEEKSEYRWSARDQEHVNSSYLLPFCVEQLSLL